MPIEELLALYNCVPPTIHTFSTSSGGKRRSKTSRNAGLDKTLMPPPDTPKTSTEDSSSEKAKDEQSEDAATAERERETKAESKIETTTKLQPEPQSLAESSSKKELETQMESKPNLSDSAMKDVTDKVMSNDSKGSDEEVKSDTLKVAHEEQPSKCQIIKEIKEVLSEANCSQKENSSKDENQWNGDDHKEYADEQETKGKYFP